MKRFRYNLPIYTVVLIIVAGIALSATAIFRLLHLWGVNNMVSFYPALDVAVVALFLGISGLCIYALCGAGYYFGARLRVVLGVPVIAVEYDKITRIVMSAEGELWLIVTDEDREKHLRISIKSGEENEFVSAVRQKVPTITYEVEA